MTIVSDYSSSKPHHKVDFKHRKYGGPRTEKAKFAPRSVCFCGSMIVKSRPCTRKLTIGSLAGVPPSLRAEIESLERQFTIDQTKLKQITHRFVSELAKGRVLDGGIAANADRPQRGRGQHCE